MMPTADDSSDRSSHSAASRSTASANSMLKAGAFLKSGTGSHRRRSTDGSFGRPSKAKAALLAVMEIQSSLDHLEDECNRSYSGSISAVPDWTITAQAVDDEEACTEFTSPPSRTSSGMLGATSVRPCSTELDLNFDSHELGFWGDIGVKSDLKGCTTGKAEMLAISKENIMPWDL